MNRYLFVGDIITVRQHPTVPPELVGIRMRVISVSATEIRIEIADKEEQRRILTANKLVDLEKRDAYEKAQHDLDTDHRHVAEEENGDEGTS